MYKRAWSIIRLALQDSYLAGKTSHADYEHALEELGPMPSDLSNPQEHIDAGHRFHPQSEPCPANCPLFH